MGIGSESAQAQTSARRPLCGQVRALAAQLHDKMHQLFSVVNNGVPTKVSWFRLFKHMDDDESGLISYSELAGRVREEWLFGHKELPEKTLKAVWLALDNDGSGRLTAGEFGAFMRLGARAQRSTATESPAQAQSPRRVQESFDENWNWRANARIKVPPMPPLRLRTTLCK